MFLAVLITPIYAEVQYTRSFIVTVTSEQTFFIWKWNSVENKTVTATVSDEDYRFWQAERVRRYGEERYRSYLEFAPEYKWLITVGVQHDAIKSIVTQLQSYFTNDEDYVNAVLLMVHQFTYKERPAKFAIETIVDGVGDCDTFSVFVATILKASGHQVVLILYRGHLEVGVHLDTAPTNMVTTAIPYSIIHKGVTYYVCECGGQNPNWAHDYWHIGDIPPDLIDQLPKAYIMSV